ncbi:Bud site selection protein, Revert to axial protein 1 [Dimargaris cristalligena]|nr:Bud site selection protein, Revert to axial protein 1 [Dimargaris cristalligena]
MDTEPNVELQSRNYFSSREILARSASCRTNASQRPRPSKDTPFSVQGLTPEKWKHVMDHNLQSGLPTLEQVLQRKSRTPISLQDFYNYVQRFDEGRRLIQFWKAVSYHEGLLSGGEIMSVPDNRQSYFSQYLNQSQFINQQPRSPPAVFQRPMSQAPLDNQAQMTRHSVRLSGTQSMLNETSYGHLQHDMVLTTQGGDSNGPQGPTGAARIDHLVIGTRDGPMRPFNFGTPHTDPEQYTHQPLSPLVKQGSYGGKENLEGRDYLNSPSMRNSAAADGHWVEPSSVEHSALHIIRKFMEQEPGSASHLSERLGQGSSTQSACGYPELTQMGVLFPEALRTRLFRTVDQQGLHAPHLFSDTKDYVFTILNHRYYSLFLTEVTTQNLSRPHALLRLVVGGFLLAAGLTLALWYIFTDRSPRLERLVTLPLVFVGWWWIISGLGQCAFEFAVLGLYEALPFRCFRMSDKRVRRYHLRTAAIQLGWVFFMTLITMLILSVVPGQRLYYG